MAIYRTRIARTRYYDIVVKAEGVAEARRKAKEWALRAPPERLDSAFFADGPFEVETAHKARQPVPARGAAK